MGRAVAWVLGVVLVCATAVVLIVQRGGPGTAGEPGTVGSAPASSSAGAQAGAALGPTSAVDLTSMTPREAATRLFNRVMAAVEAGNQGEADRFLPMAIASYDLIGVLTLDDRFHLSLLHAAAGDGPAALAVAEAGLAARPTHLLCLAAAAQAALLLGDSVRAGTHYGAFLEAYDAEIASGLEEYGMSGPGHGALLVTLREEAELFVAGRP